MNLTPSDYALIFESNKIGAAILEDLIARFGRRRNKHSSGIDRILDTERADAQREMLDFIVLRINQANGVEPNENAEG